MINQTIPTIEIEEVRQTAEPMHPKLASRTARWYVCSRCWGDLQERSAVDGVYVECVNCGEETFGYVTRHWIERKRMEDKFEALEVTRMLQRIGVLAKPKRKTVSQNLKELGF